jgi:hypothetical protein
MNRFTKLTPQVESYLQGRINSYEAGKITLAEDKIQLFQDLYDTSLYLRMSEATQKYLNLMIKNNLIKTVRPLELN